eukprot:CAMPEP_0181097400 /NCGR_PEP_ID=MMETSP1071-20121207/11548_1 /TAXON_ID=35127 /ORGANISM="Thalassiosira sp., Strain NH16" /LENGTH=147 /DNA_ID=CAMNT_0023179877 /DNA_START=58 /DNA_END=501 /DNA_ORIENTATION=-
MTYYERIVLYFDGASRHNPHGPAGCGWILHTMDDDGALQWSFAEGSEYLGYNISNNQAEYEGVINGVKYLVENDISCDKLYIRGDSQIVIRQLDGEYNVNSQNIIPYYNEAKDVLSQLNCYTTYRHVYRDTNWKADDLANEAIERGY